ncbi:protein MIZU-KUSSEI 1 [Lycium ferocissimum]|uniref:protein MIZU-KUSSEI 1 n=1 Tax=Lycium ferocissimum TaxID=112874 RepID=UPI0028166250|nr:protein MIZU-KUSSEI 1 [Lycium ferocissimum]
MKTMMAKSFQDLSSKRQFHWTAKVSNEEEQQEQEQEEATSENPSPKHPSNRNEEVKTPTENIKAQSFKNPEVSTTKSSTLNTIHENKTDDNQSASATRRKLQTIAVTRLKSVLTAFGRNRGNYQQGLGTRVVGTLFGHRRGHVHFAFQKDSSTQPAFLVELATPISGLVREMASGLVRIALECDKEEEKKVARLIDEPIWRTYCNGKKCGFATRREIGPKEMQILKAVEPISMGAGVLPGNGEEESADSGEIMYMRVKFERVIGSRDSEAFYMMNPDNNAAPELNIYLLRV